jgi:phosphatidylserine/phosphatidylglycerophosphate/cardiolipin synthase-like enzyme
VLLESRITSEEKRGYKNLPEQASLTAFEKTGVTIIKDLKNYTNVHAKIFVSDTLAIVSTTNYDDPTHDYKNKEWRDFAAIINDPKIIHELKHTLQQAFRGEEIHSIPYQVTEIKPEETRLTWTDQALSHLLHMIQLATCEIIIYQQDLQDEHIVNALCEKAKQGVQIQILMSEHPFGEKNPNKNMNNLQKLARNGTHVRLTGGKVTKQGIPLHIHAKILLIDNEYMYLGSANFYPAILNPSDLNLNIGIITRSQKYIAPVAETFKADWLEHADKALT